MSISRSLELPDGYQHHDWNWDPSVKLDDPRELTEDLRATGASMLQLYVQHELFEESISTENPSRVIKQTRSAPNWDGGLATLATCKHLVRSYNLDWRGAWFVGLCPRDLASNTVLYAGRVDEVHDSNYDLGCRVREISPEVFAAKSSLTNPRGDLYEPMDAQTGFDKYDHRHFVAPQDHTRSVDWYKKSPGSLDGLTPVQKWRRDIEYVMHGRRPKVFILRPFHLFTQPTVWSNLEPGRATLRLTAAEFADSLRGTVRL